MNKKEKLAFLKSLKNNPRITNLSYDKDILHRGWDDSIWFGGHVLSFTIDNRFDYGCYATGEIRITHLPTDDDVVSKCDDFFRVREFLLEHGLTTDKKVSAAERKGDLYFGNNNWFQDELVDTKTGGKFVVDLMENADISDGPFSVDLEYLDDYIKDYLKGE